MSAHRRQTIGFKIFLGVAFLAALSTTVHIYFQNHPIAVLTPKGPIAREETRLIIGVLLLSLIVVIPVFILLFVFSWKYRESNTKAKYTPDWDHSRIAETLWWLIPSALIFVLSIITWNVTHTLDPYRPIASSVKPLTIQVVALDWKWLFMYPEQHIATVNYVQFPKNTPLNFEITADAPMNSFWIPQLGGQIYAMPGMTTELHLLASQTGEFYGSSANISGRGFAGMNFMAKASSDIDFKQWVNGAKQSPNRLNNSDYAKLAQPSTNNHPTNYALDDTDLFGTILSKYSSPGDSMSMSMSGAETQ